MGKRRHPHRYTKRHDKVRQASLDAKRRGHPDPKRQKPDNWRVATEDGEVVAIEPGQHDEQVFDGGPDPYWDAIEFAAACLRGERTPA